jgi:NADPH-dependent 2,4-dienoyl-CoA reductase/sulfur reductase-like enzyme
MKRPRTDDSTDLSPGESNGNGVSVDVQMVNGNHAADVKPVKESTNHVVVVGAGPGGLMLAYAIYYLLL